MADQNNGPLDISLDLSNTKTVVPMVADGHLCKWRCKNIGMATSEKGKMVKYEWNLVDPAPNTDGGQIKPGEMGATFFETVTLYDKNTPAGEVPEWAKKKIAQRIDALLGTGDPGNTKGKPTRPNFDAACVAQMIGKELIAKMKVRRDENGGNDFGTLTFPGDIAVA